MGIARLADVNEWAISYDHSNWLPIYVPAPNLKIEHTNVASADSGRTEDGVMHINWVRRDIRKVNLLYNAISGKEKSVMEALMQGKEFWFRYLDTNHTADPVWDDNKQDWTLQNMATVKEIYAYTGESNYQYYSNVHFAHEGGIFTGFSINVIEF